MDKKRFSLTGHEAAKAIEKFEQLSTLPVFVEDLGFWRAGRGYYHLWQGEDGTRVVAFSYHHASTTPRYFVKAWQNENVTDRDVLEAITSHAAGLANVTLTAGILKKTNYRGGDGDIYFGGQVAYQVLHEGGQAQAVYTSYFTDENNPDGVLQRHPYIPRGYKGVSLLPHDKAGHVAQVSRRAAERMVYEHFEASRRVVLSTGNALKGVQRKSRHYYAARFLQLFHKYSQVLARPLDKAEKIDSGYGLIQEAAHLVTELSNPFSAGFALVSIGLELRGLLKKEKREIEAKGFDPHDPLVQKLSGDSVFAAPFGNFLRPIRVESFGQGAWLGKPSFAALGLDTRIHRVASLATEQPYGLAEIYLGTTLGSHVRYYFDKGQEASDHPLKDVKAIKIFRPDGLTLTIFEGRTRLWLHYDPEGHLDKNGPPLPEELMRQLGNRRILELAAPATGDAIYARPVSEDEAERFFRDHFGAGFRMRTYEDATPGRPNPAVEAGVAAGLGHDGP